MAYPTPSDYQDALQFPDAAFADPALAAGEPAQSALGLPQPITGAFAAVFPVDTAEGRFAVRCFLTRVEDQAKRYRAVADHLANAGLDAAVTFEYQPEGVRVGGTAYPLLKMAWTEGEGLATFVGRHLDRPDVLLALAEAWRRLLADLAAANIAHGDLQHGNVLVQSGDETGGAPRLVLVDYDAMFVPALAGRGSAEVGHRNYQHPDRTEADFDASLDHFAGLVVYTALRALAERPGLWAEFSTGENLLFQAGDFYDPQASPLFAALREIEGVRPLAEALATACYLEPAAVPSLDAVLAGETVHAPSHRPERRREHAARSDRRSAVEAAFLPAAVAAAVAIGAAFFVVGWTVGLVVAGLVAAVGFAVAARAYRAQSLVRRRRRTEREAAVLEQWIAELEDARHALRRDRRDFLDRLGELRTERLEELQAAALGRHLRYHFIGELDEVEGVGHRAVVRMKSIGIRNAFHATPERVAEAGGLSSETRRLIAAWRDALAAEAAADVPDALSPAEEQRLDRQIERRLKAIDAEGARVAAKAEVQRGELARVREQQAALPALTPLRYALSLFRFQPLPQRTAPSAAPILQRNTETSPAARNGHAVVQPNEEAEAPWWEQAS